MPWVGRKKIVSVPLSRPIAHRRISSHPIGNDILQRALYDLDPTTGRDRSLRAFIRAASSGIADFDAIVTERHSVDQQEVPAAILEPEIGAGVRVEGCHAAAIVMLGGRGAVASLSAMEITELSVPR